LLIITDDLSRQKAKARREKQKTRSKLNTQPK
jgi:hypothetical protein